MYHRRPRRPRNPTNPYTFKCRDQAHHTFGNNNSPSSRRRDFHKHSLTPSLAIVTLATTTVKVKAHKIALLSKEQLSEMLEENKQELATLRIAKVSGQVRLVFSFRDATPSFVVVVR
jgi:hypothetical protein